ncbi:LuxR C-terminal-related transcriptional regulator [Allosalinactinospora lopnorensis]|uniref:LuxR C-terminal-related transcriptional regulator n=1 Tax=Allosalinactinospora lopnorensis TaxID=1352348 RepID=UPI00069611CA|nr:response regulator transcription factor [Allosalinactinospora lopnorensis]
MLERRKRATVVVADPHPLIVAGLRAVIEEDDAIEVAGVSCDVGSTVQQVSRTNPDLVLIEFGMLDEGAEALTSMADERGKRATVVALSDHPEKVVAALKAGAQGFLLKNSPLEDVIVTIWKALNGSVPVSPQSLPYLVSEVRNPADGSALSQREREVLQLVAEGLSNAKIADMLFVSEATIKTHVQRTFRKLGVHDRASAVAKGIANGILAVRRDGGRAHGGSTRPQQNLVSGRPTARPPLEKSR